MFHVPLVLIETRLVLVVVVPHAFGSDDVYSVFEAILAFQLDHPQFASSDQLVLRLSQQHKLHLALLPLGLLSYLVVVLCKLLLVHNIFPLLAGVL